MTALRGKTQAASDAAARFPISAASRVTRGGVRASAHAPGNFPVFQRDIYPAATVSTCRPR